MLTSNTSKPKTRRPRWLTSLLPRAYSSLYSRLLLVMALAVGGSFFLATSIWLASMHSEKESDALLSVEDLAISMAQTVLYFEGLPKTYQHIILDQQRNLGGSRFFLSVNEERIEYETIEDNPLKTRLISAYETAFRDRVGVRVRAIDVNFAYPDKLRVFNKDVLFSELPSRWVQNNLVLNPPAPLLVAQMQMSNGDWLYLASLMLPDPYVVEGIPPFTHEQLVFTLILSFILMLSSWFIVRWMTAPLRQLSEAASLLGRDIHQVPVPEKGTFEVRETARAFNLMQRRILALLVSATYCFRPFPTT
ncbi:HAMP domain-containing protein [Nitrincola nitratireducens]|uniref:histidine kinase n=1 Tax=Nitrincola nitratireducens TaxID=1229521 RepID=W9VAA7_9GAMM|nr:HAMP domain-containing protein [Nitrincola nitratireducens]EXJ12987.1 osmolarity sensor protein [Nitrincola nitratireducens]